MVFFVYTKFVGDGNSTIEINENDDYNFCLKSYHRQIDRWYKIISQCSCVHGCDCIKLNIVEKLSMMRRKINLLNNNSNDIKYSFDICHYEVGQKTGTTRSFDFKDVDDFKLKPNCYSILNSSYLSNIAIDSINNFELTEQFKKGTYDPKDLYEIFIEVTSSNSYCNDIPKEVIQLIYIYDTPRLMKVIFKYDIHLYIKNAYIKKYPRPTSTLEYEQVFKF